MREISLDSLKPIFQVLTNSDVVISPWIAKVDGNVRFDSNIFDILSWRARDFANVAWTAEMKVRTFGDLPIPKRLPRTALYETMASTSVMLANERTGQLDVDEDIAAEAIELVEQLVTEFGFDMFLQVYSIVTAYDNYQALAYYESIPEHIYLSGEWHRPWIDYSLDDELIYSCETGTTRVVLRDGQRFVELTEKGHARYRDVANLLSETGYLRRRIQLLRISQFSHLGDYEEIMRTLAPHGVRRQEFLTFCSIQPGMSILELGCGSGAFTFDGGLANQVGPTGHIVAMDPAAGMLARAESKRQQFDIPWVEFHQGKAETLPFPDDTFDAVVGMLFMHFTDIPTAVKEMARVTKPGGIIASFHPLHFPSTVPFVIEWFAPLFAKAAQRAEPPRNLMPGPDVVPAIFQSVATDVVTENVNVVNVYDNPDAVVRFFIESAGVFQDEMSHLPWLARQEMFETLKENGKRICATRSREELTVQFPGQSVRGHVL